MIYGRMIQNGEESYTHLKKLFDSIDGIQLHYKWLISYPECYPQSSELGELLSRKFCILSGKELTDMVCKEDLQWIWGTLSAFDPSVSDEEILNHPLPENNGYTGFWKYPLTMQHPLSKMEIVAFDSSCTLVFTRDFTLPEGFIRSYPLAEDLAEKTTDPLSQ